MQIIKVNVDNKDFEFKAESSFLDEQKIKTEIAFLSGGQEKYLEFENLLIEAYREHTEFNKLKFGIEQYRLFENTIVKKPAHDLTEEERQTLSEIRNNKHWLKYFQMQQEKAKLYSYAWLKVMCLKKPLNFEFYEAREEQLERILEVVEKEQEFFRKKDQGPSEANKA